MIRNDKYQELFNKFNEIEYVDSSHSYFLHGTKLTSVTTYLSNKYLKPFDAWKVAGYLAKSSGKSQQYWIEYWRLLGLEASTIGSRVHHFASWYSSTSKPKDALEEAVVSFYEDAINDGYEIVCTELAVYNNSLAGRFDLLMYSDNDGYWLIDFKTNNKDLNVDTKEFNDGTKKTLLEFYGMQLATYEHLLGLGKIRKTVVHITEDGYKLLEC